MSLDRIIVFLSLFTSLTIIFSLFLIFNSVRPYDAGMLIREIRIAYYSQGYNRTITLYLQYPVYIYNGCIVFEVPVPPYGSSITLPVRVYKNMTLQGLVTLSIVKERGFIWLKRC